MSRPDTTFLFAVLLGLLLPCAALAQGTIEGQVIDQRTETSIPGVNVVLQGTQYGAAADVNGHFSFTAPEGEYELTASFVGYKQFSQNITVVSGETVSLDIPLEEDLVGLEEVVVTALGIERSQRSLGYATQQVEGAGIVQRAESNVVNALAGEVAGVNIGSSSGQPGSSSRITIRGISSLTGSNQPLFVVDGVPISNAEDGNNAESTVFVGGTSNRGLDIDPNMIESVNVLKGASATALYGSRASNGVIVITTKGGAREAARPQITYTSRMRADNNIVEGFQTDYLAGTEGYFTNGLPADRGGFVEPGLFDPEDGVEALQTTQSWGPHRDEISPEVYDALAELGQLVDGEVPLYDPRADFYQTGLVAENSLSISGGSETSNYFVSISDLRQQGTVPGTRLDRTSLMARFGTQVTDRLDISTSINYVNTENDWLREGNGALAYFYVLNSSPINFDLTDYEYEDGSQRMFTTAWNNPHWLTENQRYGSDVDRYIGNVQLTYELAPWLTLEENLGIDNYTDARKEEINIGSRGRPNGSMFDRTIRRREVNSDLTLRADTRLSQDVGLNAVVGHNYNHRQYQSSLLRGENLNIPGFYNISNANSIANSTESRSEQVIVGLYTALSFDYQDYVYLNLTARNDWSSTLPAGNNSYFYPSASLSFVFTDAFDIGGDVLSFGRVRTSVAQVGSDASPYQLATNFVQASPGDGQRGTINVPYQGINAYTVSSTLGNPDLRPELSTEYEVGVDLYFFERRLRMEGSYYDRTTTDQIFNVPVSAATGYVTRSANAGTIRNRGYEISLSGTPVQTRDFSLDMQANFSANVTDVVELAPGVENIFLFGFTNPQIRAMEGENGYGVIWGTRYQRNDEGQLLIDDEGYPMLDSELGPIGNVQPDWLGNLRTTLTYRGLTASALIDVREGGDILNFDGYYNIFYGTHIETANRGTTYLWEGVNVNTGEANDVEVVRDQAYYQGFYTNSFENLVEDGSFLKLREISLSYAVPTSLVQSIGLQSANITATGRNLWIRSDFTYGDPEGSLGGAGNGQGFYHAVTPGTRSYSLSLRLGI